MVWGGGAGPLWGLFASSDTVPYAVLAATVSIGIVLIGGLAALSVKGRTGLPHGFRRHPVPPLPDPVLGHAKRQAPIADRPSDRLLAADSGGTSQEPGAESNLEAPAADASLMADLPDLPRGDTRAGPA